MKALLNDYIAIWRVLKSKTEASLDAKKGVIEFLGARREPKGKELIKDQNRRFAGVLGYNLSENSVLRF